MLIIFAGLPGTGKTTVGRLLATRLGATYLRIDEIEHVLGGLFGTVGPAGYGVAQAVAESNLVIGQRVVADSVNPVAESRAAWRAVGRRAGKPVLEVAFICSDTTEHRRRIEARRPDIAGFTLPTWQAVQAIRYEPWADPPLILDTATLAPSEAATCIMRAIAACS